jgi:hypothetical protein
MWGVLVQQIGEQRGLESVWYMTLLSTLLLCMGDCRRGCISILLYQPTPWPFAGKNQYVVVVTVQGAPGPKGQGRKGMLRVLYAE